MNTSNEFTDDNYPLAPAIRMAMTCRRLRHRPAPRPPPPTITTTTATTIAAAVCVVVAELAPITPVSAA